MENELGTEGIKALKKEIKFGDVIINHFASEDNPTREGVFIRHIRRQKTPCIQVTDTKGKFWELFFDKGCKIEIIGNLLKEKVFTGDPEVDKILNG